MIPQAAIAFTSNQVLHGDCLQLMRGIPDKSVDMILCDLPYGTTACKWDVIIPFEPLWEQYKRIVKPNAAIVLTASQPFSSQLVMSNPKWFRYCWVWRKGRFANQLLAKFQPLKIHEDIIIFSKKSANYNPQGLHLVNKVTRQGSRITDNNGGGIRNRQYFQEFGNYPKSILDFPSHGSTIHPTQKPVTLFEYLIKTYTKEGDLVLDNCAGSGTTAIACLNTNRNYILMEKEQQYIDVIHERLSQPRQLRLIA